MNVGTCVVGILLLILVGSIVMKMVRDKKKGKSSCGGQCSCCAHAGVCHPSSPQAVKKQK